MPARTELPRHRIKPSIVKTALAIIVVAWLCPGNAVAQGPGGTPASTATSLPPAAQAALDKGLAAAKQEQWFIAIQSLDQARQLAPKSPAILFNQALAESRVPGRELRSIVLFKAYLAAAPAAPNAAAVKDQIASLQIKVEGTIESLFDQAQDVAPKLSNTSNFGPSDQAYALEELVKFKATNGDIGGAKQIALTCGDPSACLSEVMSAQARSGDFDGAKSTANQAASAGPTGLAKVGILLSYRTIIADEAKAGKIQDALNDLADHRDVAEPDSYGTNIGVLLEIANAQYRAGQEEVARQTLNRAANNIKEYVRIHAAGIDPQDETDNDYRAIADTQLYVFHDVEEALKTASLLSPQVHANYLSDPFKLNDGYLQRMLAEWKKGNFSAAGEAVSQDNQTAVLSLGVGMYGWKEGELRAANVRVMGQDSRGKDYCNCMKDDLLRLIQARANVSEVSFSRPPSPKDPVGTWTDLLSDPLNDMLFTDLHYQLQVISGQATPIDIFKGLLKAAQQTADASTKIKQTEAALTQ